MGRTQALLVAIITTILLLPFANAVGISHEYLENRTLTLGPGEEYYFRLVVQNEENKTKVMNISMQSEIATLVGGGLVELQPLTYDAYVLFHIQVPTEANPGTRYPISFSLRPAPTGEGQVPFGIAYSRSIDVLVSGSPRVIVEGPPVENVPDLTGVIHEEQPAQSSWWSLALIIIVLALMIFVVFMLWQRSGAFAKKMTRPAKASMPQREKESTKTLKKTIWAKPNVPKPEARAMHAFVCADGRALHTLRELRDALMTMEESAFKHHVQIHKNDFAAWVHHSFHDEQLAKKIAGTHDRKTLIQVLTDAVE